MECYQCHINGRRKSGGEREIDIIIEAHLLLLLLCIDDPLHDCENR